MLTKTFWLAAIERAIKTLAQTAAALLTGSATGLLEVDWLQLTSVAGMAALVSLLTSIASAATTDGSPSLGSSEVLASPGQVASAPVASAPVEVVPAEVVPAEVAYVPEHAAPDPSELS